MRNYKVGGDHIQVKLSRGKDRAGNHQSHAGNDRSVRLQVSVGDEAARIYLGQIVEEGR